jgi:hypothetical protein
MVEEKRENITTQELHNYTNNLVTRFDYASQLGVQYGGKRDLYNVLGYKNDLTIQDYVVKYNRLDIAKAIIDRPIEECWRNGFIVKENMEEGDTVFEKSFLKLYKDFNLKDIFIRIDKLTCLGKYGVLLLGFNDTNNMSDFQNPVSINKNLKLNYIKPLREDSSLIASWETRTSSPRLGQPKLYNITLQSPSGNSSTTFTVDHTRILHITKDLMESTVYGTPQLRSVFNRLDDLEKIVGGSAEMFWKGARPGYQAVTKDGYSLPTDMADTMKEQLNEFENNLRRVLTLDGVEMKGLNIQVSSPIEHVKVQLQMISAETAIPLRILTGSEVGELASSQDRNNWLETVHTRRTDHAEPNIIDKFIKIMMEYNILPKVDTYTVVWSDLFSLSEKSKVDIGNKRAMAIEAYLRNPMAIGMIPPKEFVKIALGLDKTQLESITNSLNEGILEELKSTRTEETNIDGNE